MESFFKIILISLILGTLSFVFYGNWERRNLDTNSTLFQFINSSDKDDLSYVSDYFMHIGGGYAIYDIQLKANGIDYFLNNGFSQTYANADTDWVAEYFTLTVSNLHPSSEIIKPYDFNPVCVLSKDIGDKNARVFLGNPESHSNRAILIVMIP